MNKPEIKLNQVAYVQVTQDILSEIMHLGTAQGDEMILISASVLRESWYDIGIGNTEIVSFIDQVLEEVSGIDIIFHL